MGLIGSPVGEYGPQNLSQGGEKDHMGRSGEGHGLHREAREPLLAPLGDQLGNRGLIAKRGREYGPHREARDPLWATRAGTIHLCQDPIRSTILRSQFDTPSDTPFNTSTSVKV